MGGGASSIMVAPEGGVMSGSASEKAGVVRQPVQRNRQRIFEKGGDGEGLDIDNLLHGDHIDETTRKVLIDALGGFYFLQGGNSQESKLDMFLRAMQKEECEEGNLLIQEGEPGSKL